MRGHQRASPPSNCVTLAKAGADSIATITSVWEHAQGPAAAVAEFQAAIKKARSYYCKA